MKLEQTCTYDKDEVMAMVLASHIAKCGDAMTGYQYTADLNYKDEVVLELKPIEQTKETA